jgi:hypothetical protein
LLDDLPGAPGGGSFAMDDSGPIPGEGEEGIITNGFDNGATPFSTNSLWLAISNVADNTVYANLYNGTDSVYEIFSTTNLLTPTMALTNWDIETEVFPDTNTVVMPFTTCMEERPNLFLWARDWTGITSNGNETPDWWFYYWFGVNGLGLLDTNTDVFGNTYLTDYNTPSDPDYITYSLQSTNLYHVANPAGLAINLQTGIPVYEAVLINDTNTAHAAWKRYTSTNLTVNLSNGLCTVYVGLRGRPSDAQETWRLAQLTLNDTPLTLAVASPADTISQPMIQVQGYASKPLASLTFDVSNASGVFTGQPGYITSQYCDTNLQMVTTNYFQCYDVRVTNGLNLVTLHATGTAGETTSTGASFTLDYSSNTNPPVLSIIWPPNGTAISGTNFNLQAQVDDDTATVTAQMTDATGDTNTVQGLVERSGLVWAHNLPIAAGTNTLTVTATDAGGYSTTTNLTVVQSAVTVSVNPLSGTNLNQSSVTVTGTVSDTNETVYVNGVQATVHTDGTWTACMVPASPTGTATFTVQAYSSDSTLDGSQTSDQEQAPTIVLADYQMQTGHSSGGDGENQSAQWDYAAGGNWAKMHYPSGNGPEGGWDIGGLDPDIPPDGTDYAPPIVASDQGETLAPTFQISDEHITEGDDNLQTKTKTTPAIIPSDQEQPGGVDAYLVEVTANEFSDLANDENIFGLNLGGANQGDLQDPPQWMQINGQSVDNSGITNDDGSLPGLVPIYGPSATPLALSVAFTQSYTNNDHPFNVKVYQLVSQCVQTTPANQSRTNLGVGEQVNLFFNPTLPPNLTNVTWSTSAGGLAVTSGTTNLFTAPSNAAVATVSATVSGTLISNTFNVFEPTGVVYAIITQTQNIVVPGMTIPSLTNGEAGAQMVLEAFFGPTNVSFYRVSVMEVGENASNLSGYFSQYTPSQLAHTTANFWTPLNRQNYYSDLPSGGPFPPPWSPGGSFGWDIPANWQVTGSGQTNSLAGWNQNFSIDSSGTVTIQKWGRSVTRTTNNVITIN